MIGPAPFPEELHTLVTGPSRRIERVKPTVERQQISIPEWNHNWRDRHAHVRDPFLLQIATLPPPIASLKTQIIYQI